MPVVYTGFKIFFYSALIVFFRFYRRIHKTTDVDKIPCVGGCLRTDRNASQDNEMLLIEIASIISAEA